MTLRTVVSHLLRATLAVSIITLLAPGSAWAQTAGGGSGADSKGSGAPPMRANTPFEDFVGTLRLDLSSQVPQTEQLMNQGAKAASGVVGELLKTRQQLLTAALTEQADKGPVLEAHTRGAARLAAAEAATFAQVYALLRPNQQSRAPRAFAEMAGFFYPPFNPGPAGRAVSGAMLGRLDILAKLFSLDNAQKREIRGWLDQTHKSLAPTRQGLAETRQALAQALMSGDQAAIDSAASAYAVHATAMADAEMTSLARILQRLTPEQRENQRAVGGALGLMRGFFADARRWDFPPDGRGY